MFSTTIIPTIGRSTLSRAVWSVLSQEFDHDDFEVIVVNDSGRPLPEMDWQDYSRVQVIHTNRRERSVARNVGAALAQGKYLHFLDDDDWLLPDALNSIWKLSQATEAVWLYGASQLVDREGQQLIELHHGMSGNCFVQVMAGEWIPLQASFIEARKFFVVGGFNPLLAGPEDVDICRRIVLLGDLAETPSLVACISMGVENSTTDYGRSALGSRKAREEILDASGVFGRLRTSATSNEWFGRIVRVYLTSAVWNTQHNRPFTAASRALFGLVSLSIAWPHILSTKLWRSILTSYDSYTFVKAYKLLDRPVLRRAISK